MPALTFRVCNPISPARFLFAHFDSFFPFQRGADSILLPFSLVIYIKLSFSKDLLGARYFLLRRGWAANHSARLASARSRARSLACSARIRFSALRCSRSSRAASLRLLSASSAAALA
jgi:hypothetical protein